MSAKVGKKTNLSTILRLNQHTTIKYCNEAVLLGDGGGMAAFW
jgi:hypothetical protein